MSRLDLKSSEMVWHGNPVYDKQQLDGVAVHDHSWLHFWAQVQGIVQDDAGVLQDHYLLLWVGIVGLHRLRELSALLGFLVC